MNHRSLAISILQQARDQLADRLAERVVESRGEIEADAEGQSYLSEIETIYEQIGGRLAHLNAMLANLPSSNAMQPAEATASEIVYADLASAYSAGLDLEATAPMTLLALPAPSNYGQRTEAQTLGDVLERIVVTTQEGDTGNAARAIGELFDIKPSQARRAAATLAERLSASPDLVHRVAELAATLETVNEYAAATLLGECFDFQPIEALAIVRALKGRLSKPD